MNIIWLRPDKPENVSVGRHQLGLELERRGHDVTIQNTTLKEFRTVLSDEPDVIVGTTRLGAFVGAWKRLISGTPLVIDHIDPIMQLRRSHGRAMTWCVSQAEKVAFQIADHVMVVYEEELPRVRRYASTVTHTSLGVDYNLFANPPEKIIESAHHTVATQVPNDENVVLYVGGLEPPYHIPAIVDAMDHLNEWHFVVLGDGTQRNWFEAVDDNHDRVHYLGTVPYEEVPGYMHLADVGISLIDDPYTLKLLEYGAAELPVVQVEGDAEELFDGMMTFTSLNPPSIASAIEDATTIDTTALSGYARERSWNEIATEYERILERLVMST
jgi:glycosyltransferase involved in cell wall biosynthesis